MGPAVLTRWPAECCLLSCAATSAGAASVQIEMSIEMSRSARRGRAPKPGNESSIYLEVRLSVGFKNETMPMEWHNKRDFVAVSRTHFSMRILDSTLDSLVFVSSAVRAPGEPRQESAHDGAVPLFVVVDAR